jgi:hypothetical protein
MNIEITCPSANRNTHHYLYGMSNDMPLIVMTISDDQWRSEQELSVSEAERIAKDLMEWVKEIKGEEGEST